LPLAFMLINSEAGAEDGLLKELRELESVEEAYGVYGAYDIIVKVRASTEKELKEIATWKIRKLDKVRSTLTVVASNTDPGQA
jgi:DNA-binding Lrp family transcriptional regulator